MAKKEDIDFDIVLKKDAKDSINSLPDEMGIDDIDSVWDSLVNDVKGEIGSIEIVDDFEVIDAPITKPDDCKTPAVLSVIDKEFKESIMARNVVCENALMIIMSGFEKIMASRGVSTTMIAKIRDLRDVSMKKDKIAAIQKYDAIASEINEFPDNETNAIITAFLYVYYEIFFSRIDL